MNEAFTPKEKDVINKSTSDEFLTPQPYYGTVDGTEIPVTGIKVPSPEEVIDHVVEHPRPISDEELRTARESLKNQGSSTVEIPVFEDDTETEEIPVVKRVSILGRSAVISADARQIQKEYKH